MRAWLAFGVLLAAASTASAQTEKDAARGEIETLERQMDVAAGERALAKTEAARLGRDVDGLRREIKRASDAMRRRQAAAREAAEAAADAKVTADAARASIDVRRRELSALLGAMARLTRRPPEALAALNEGPKDAARASLAFDALLPAIEIRIVEARSALQRASDLIAAHEARQTAAEEAAAAAATERKALNQALREKRRLMRSAQAADSKLADAVAKMAQQARSLDAFIEALTAREAAVAAARKLERDRAAAAARAARLEAARRQALAARPAPKVDGSQTAEPKPGAGRLAPPMPPEPAPPPAQPPVDLAGLSQTASKATPPVSGRLAARFGQGEGLQSRGFVYDARAEEEVYTPYDGKVVYAGPFRGYGSVALIDHGEGYHTLLTGLGRIDVAVGDWVLQGEPLGALPSEGADGASGAGGAKLYVELRKDGEPVDPAPWFARPT